MAGSAIENYRLYKYRGLSENKIQYLMDILLKSRVFMADWRKFNDPFEGEFRINGEESDSISCLDSRDYVIKMKVGLKVCSFCKTALNPLLWAHYADGFNGVAIEMEGPSTFKPVFKEVVYTNDIPEYHHRNIQINEELAMEILSRKRSFWKYEEEVRMFWRDKDTEFFPGMKINSVIFGLRVNKPDREKIMEVCKSKGYICRYLMIGDNYELYIQ